MVSVLLRSAWAEREARLCAWNPVIILSPRVSKYIMQGQSGILLGKEAGNILPPSLLVLIHSFIHSGAIAGSEPCTEVNEEGSMSWAVESDRSGFESDPLPRTVVKLNYSI